MSQESSGGEAPRIANTRQLLFAIGLGVVVVVLYNVQVNSIRNETKAEVELLVYKVNKKAGEVLRSEDVERRKVPRAAAGGLPSVLKPEQISDDGVQRLQRDVPAQQYVFHEDLYGSDRGQPSSSLPDDDREFSLPIDNQNLGRVVRVGDKIDVWAMMPSGGGYKATLVVSGVTVRSIGGISTGTSHASRQADDQGVSSYRQIGIQIHNGEVPKLLNLRTWAQSQQFTYTLRSPMSQLRGDGMVSEDLKRFYETTAPARNAPPVAAAE